MSTLDRLNVTCGTDVAKVKIPGASWAGWSLNPPGPRNIDRPAVMDTKYY
jgi:hypothetical protein